jgi:predicted DNA-binding transcriptional regulator YafY
MSRDSPLVRQWVLLGSLYARHQGMTVREIAEEMAVDERTIRRDLEVFAWTGFPLEETVCAHGLKKWRIDPTKTRPGVSFAFDEAVAIQLSLTAILGGETNRRTKKDAPHGGATRSLAKQRCLARAKAPYCDK